MLGPEHLAPLLIVAVEIAFLFFAPTMLARLAFVPLAARRRISLARGSAPAVDPGSPARPLVPRLALSIVELDDAVLVQGRGSDFVLRRRYDRERNRAYYLVRILVELEGNDLVVRARLALIPVTLPLSVLAFALGSGQADRWSDAGIFGGIAALAMFVVFPLSIAGRRDAAIQQAFDLVERELRRGLETTTPSGEPRTDR